MSKVLDDHEQHTGKYTDASQAPRLTAGINTIGGAPMAGRAPPHRCALTAQWTNDAARPVTTNRFSDVRHLMSDATVAQDLAIRYADVTRGRRSGHFEGLDAYERTRDECMTRLFGAIGANHGVEVTQVRELLTRRPLEVDLSVILTFGVFCVLMSNVIISGIFSRFDTSIPLVTAVVIVGIVLSACSLLVLGMWAGLIEMIRLGNGHMSYRGERLPWNHHLLALFAAGVGTFWGMALLRSYRRWSSF